MIKGVEMLEEVTGDRRKRTKYVKEMLKDKLGVTCEVNEVRKSGPVLVARIEGEEGKKEVMRNKFKLKGDKMFIENDLSFDERKVQEKLGRWAKAEREEGVEVKIGRGRAKVRGKWIMWEAIERQEKDRGERESRMKEGEGRGKPDFG